MKNILANLEKKVIILCFVIVNIFFTYYFLKYNHFSLEYIKTYFLTINGLIDSNTSLYFFIFFLIYFSISVFAIPVAALFSLLIGALFGFYKGVLLVSFSSSLGALVCFLLSRYLFRDYLQKKFNKKLSKINKEIKENGHSFLFLMRMTPVIPFFLINLLYGLTTIKALNFYIISQLGMLAGTCLYINAGNQISEIQSIEELLSIKILVSFSLIGFFPFFCKKVIFTIKNNLTRR